MVIPAQSGSHFPAQPFQDADSAPQLMQPCVGSGPRVRCQPVEGRGRVQEIAVCFFLTFCHAVDRQLEGFGCS
nr:hypothetical protein GCM10017547_31470 [Pseudarthrobacter oxydans]